MRYGNILPQQTFDESNPWIQAASALNSIQQQQADLTKSNLINQYLPAQLQQQQTAGNLANQTSQVQLNYLPSTLQNQVLAGQLANQTNQVKLKYLPGQEQAQTALLQQQVPNLEAQTAFTQQRTAVLPDQVRAALLLAQAKAAMVPYFGMRATSNALNSVNQLYNNPGAQATFLSDPSTLQNAVNTIHGGLQGLSNFYGGQQGIPQGTMPVNSGLQNNNILNQSGGMGANSLPLASQAPQNNAPQTGMSNVGTIPLPQNNDELNAVRDALQSSMIKTNETTQQRNQKLYDLSAQNMIKQVEPFWPTISQYTGLGGTLKLATDQSLASLGVNVPSYTAYKNFTTTQAPLLANEIRRAYGGQATDSEREVMSELVNPSYWNSNPGIAANQLHTIINTLAANTSALTNSGAQIQNVLAPQSSGQSSLPVSSQSQPQNAIPMHVQNALQAQQNYNNQMQPKYIVKGRAIVREVKSGKIVSVDPSQYAAAIQSKGYTDP